MTPALRNGLILVLIGFLFITFGMDYRESVKESEAKNPVKDGYIKDGHTVSFDEEKALAEQSFPHVDDEEYAESMLYGFLQCLLSAEAIGNSAYICLSNNVADSAIDGLVEITDESERGIAIYSYLSEGKVMTSADIRPISNEEGQAYELRLDLNRNEKLKRYRLFIKEKQIIKFELKK